LSGNPNLSTVKPTLRSRPARRVAVRLISAVVAFWVCSGFATVERLFAPSADLWKRWTAHDETNGERIDHHAWDGFLARYVVPGPDGATWVNYAGVDPADRAGLDRYLEFLGDVPISRYARDEQLAFWINLYNALTIRVILDHYPVASIRDIEISPGLFAVGPWDKKLITVEGEEISLGDIEHRIIRPIWRDPRAHYALNCASIGCPNLAATAYTGDTLEDRLTGAAIEFVNSPRALRVTDGRITASRIYDWFYADFGGTDAAVLEHILKYLEAERRQLIQSIGKINDVAYDWRLNDAGWPGSL
jgi:hypothetical protein